MNGLAAQRLTVTIPPWFLEERKYILTFILDTILGYEILWKTTSNSQDTSIDFPRGYNLTLKDSFFLENRGTYIRTTSLPGSPQSLLHPATKGEDLVFLYGDRAVQEKPGKSIIGPDIIASAFFLLSRWEEMVISERDQWGRIPNEMLYARRHGIDERPLVDEYAAWIGALAYSHGEAPPRDASEFRIFSTHDVDKLYYRKMIPMLGDLIKYKAPKRFIAWSLYKALLIDQSESFEYIMSLNESRNEKATFYFMSGGISPFDDYYGLEEPTVKKLLQEITQRGHRIGFHPSFATSLDSKTMSEEKARLEGAAKEPVVEIRQHFLKAKIPDTIRLWEVNGIRIDSSMGFSRGNGFRCGTGREYPLFDPGQGRVTAVCERPLLIMDAAIRKGHNRQPDIEKSRRIIKACIRYQCPCTILFHNHLIDRAPWNDMRPLFSELMRNTYEGTNSHAAAKK